MPFSHLRTIRFQDTDAAGVVYFANALSICHEAYEASLAAAGIDLKSFFRGESIAVPIVHAEISYFQPMFCGETYLIEVAPKLLSPDKFQIHYTVRGPVSAADMGEQTAHSLSSKSISEATTVHLCIDPATRKRMPLPSQLSYWLDTIPSNLDIPFHTGG